MRSVTQQLSPVGDGNAGLLLSDHFERGERFRLHGRSFLGPTSVYRSAMGLAVVAETNARDTQQQKQTSEINDIGSKSWRIAVVCVSGQYIAIHYSSDS